MNDETMDSDYNSEQPDNSEASIIEKMTGLIR